MIKHLLCIVTNMNTGGAETFLMKVYRQLDKTKYQMDFCICNLEKNFYENEIIKMGGKIYHLPMKTKNPFKYCYLLFKLIHSNKYNYVFRLGSTIFETFDLYIAMLAGAKIRVFRSCNANSGHHSILIKFHKIFRKIIMKIANVKFAPSDLAAKFTFGNIKNVHLLNNGLDTKQFEFSLNKLRQELNIQDSFVVGHIGRFNFQKNHKFLLKIFSEIKKQKENANLLLIGKGELEKEVKEQAKELNISDSIKFLGVRSDIPELLSAMDVFVFPSLFEGMPNTVIEAQTNGLPCLISDTITKQAKQTDIVNFMSLKQTPLEWANKAIEITSKQRLENRSQFALKMKQKGYDISDTTEQLINFVFKEKTNA